MEPQTESSTEIDVDRACFEKAKMNGEETFTLRAQDITAPLCIDFWVKVQQRMRGYLTQGFTLAQAEEAVRGFYFLTPEVEEGDTKLSQACAMAGRMERWPNRKLAD